MGQGTSPCTRNHGRYRSPLFTGLTIFWGREEITSSLSAEQSFISFKCFCLSSTGATRAGTPARKRKKNKQGVCKIRLSKPRRCQPGYITALSSIAAGKVAQAAISSKTMPIHTSMVEEYTPNPKSLRGLRLLCQIGIVLIDGYKNIFDS